MHGSRVYYCANARRSQRQVIAPKVRCPLDPKRGRARDDNALVWSRAGLRDARYASKEVNQWESCQGAKAGGIEASLVDVSRLVLVPMTPVPEKGNA